MIQLYFVPSKVPRTWTRKQWKDAYRWVRIIQKQIEKDTAEQLANLAAFGTTHPEFVREWMDKAVNPPLLLGPGMEL